MRISYLKKTNKKVCEARKINLQAILKTANRNIHEGITQV